MRAAILFGQEDVRLGDVPEPELKPGEVRIAIRAALTCGTDLKVFKRGYHARMIVPPAVFGHELAGVLSEVHPEAADWRVGDRAVVANSAPCGQCFFCARSQENLCEDLLFLNGAYAESIVVPARLVSKNLHRLRDETDFKDAALTEPLACVVQGMADLHPQAGEKALVIGAGPIGLMFVALLREAGCSVTVAGRGTGRLSAATRLGAETVLDLAGVNDTVEGVRQRTATAFDLVVEAVGKPETWEASFQLVRKGGRINFFGGCPSGTFVRLDTSRVHYSNLVLLASFHHTPRTIRQSLDLIERGVIKAQDFVDGEAPLSKLPELFKEMTAGNRSVKTLIRVDQ